MMWDRKKASVSQILAKRIIHFKMGVVENCAEGSFKLLGSRSRQKYVVAEQTKNGKRGIPGKGVVIGERNVVNWQGRVVKSLSKTRRSKASDNCRLLEEHELFG